MFPCNAPCHAWPPFDYGGQVCAGAANAVSCAVFKVLLEEYGGGRYARKHSTFYKAMMEEFGLDTCECVETQHGVVTSGHAALKSPPMGCGLELHIRHGSKTCIRCRFSSGGKPSRPSRDGSATAMPAGLALLLTSRPRPQPHPLAPQARTPTWI